MSEVIAVLRGNNPVSITDSAYSRDDENITLVINDISGRELYSITLYEWFTLSNDDYVTSDEVLNAYLKSIGVNIKDNDKDYYNC